MIRCPKCKKTNIIMEQPKWTNDENHPTIEFVEVQSYCIDCSINFTTKHKLSPPIRVYDIEENADYSY